MSLSKTITLSVNDYNINLSSNIKFYKNDQLKLIFEINGYGINVMNSVRVKTLMPIAPLNATLFIETPLGVDSIESANIEDNAVTFYLSSAQTQHVGISHMQIQLSDEDGCQVTLPPFEFEIRENIYDGEVVLQEVLLADEDNNVIVDENGNALNTGTQVSSQTYSVALSTDGTKTTSSIPTKQIQDYNLKITVEGTEDLLIQDNGVTKRIKSSELMNSVDLTGYATESYVQNKIAEASLGGEVDLSDYVTKDELNTKANISHTHTVSEITNLVIPTVDVDKSYVDTQLATKANVSDIPNLNDYALKTDIPTVPTKTSELANDTGFITTIPTEYITESELNTELSTKANISDIPSLDGYATETFVTNKIAEASLSGGEVDLSGLATKDELNSSLATKSDVGHTHEQYLTEHQDISMKADKTELHSHTNKTVLDGITSTKVTEWNNKSNFDGNYNSLTNKPNIPTVDVNKNYVDTQLATKANKSEIPSLDGYATETYVQNKIAEASLSGGEVDLSEYATKDDLNTKADKTAIPTKVSQLTNDKGYLTSVPSEYVTETELNDKGYLTEHQDISGKANISDLSDVATSGNYNDLINTPTIPNEYVLPIASTTTLGGIKVGSGLSIDTNGVLSATDTGGTDTGGTVGNGIIFNDSYIADCNRWLTNGYVKTNTSTLNLPALCTGVDRWGVLFFIAENATNGTGTQMYFPVDGKYKGRVFTRSLTAMSMNGQASEWILLVIQSDIIPNLVGNTAANKTLTLTVDKYQYAVLSNGDSVVLPSVSSFTEIHLFFKADTDLTLTFPSVRWQSIPSIASGHTYEIIFTYVVDEWLAGVICYE